MAVLHRFVPAWIRNYQRPTLGADLAAGLIVAILVIPQSLAYALLAGLPPQAGLYISIFPVLAYALLGSSMVQAVGPVAITAIMTYAVLSPISPRDLQSTSCSQPSSRSCRDSCCLPAVLCASVSFPNC